MKTRSSITTSVPPALTSATTTVPLTPDSAPASDTATVPLTPNPDPTAPLTSDLLALLTSLSSFRQPANPTQPYEKVYEFDGSSNVNAWIDANERRHDIPEFQHLFQNDKQKILRASLSLTGNASTWFSQVNPTLTSWKNFKDRLKNAFGGSNTIQEAQNKIETLKFHSIQDYSATFSTYGPITGYNDQALIHMYTRSLPIWLKQQLGLLTAINQAPQNFFEYMELTTKVYHTRSNQSLNPIPARPNQTLISQPLNRITDSEREYLKANFGCYRCRKLGHTQRNCPESVHQKINSVISNDTMNDTIANLKKQMNTLASRLENMTNKEDSNYSSIHRPLLECQTHSNILRALLDTGSSLNVIDSTIANKFGLTITTLKNPINLTFANSNTTSTNKITRLDISLGPYKTTISAVVLPISEQLILGTPWLKTIRIKTFDLATSEFTFSNNQTTYKLKFLPARDTAFNPTLSTVMKTPFPQDIDKEYTPIQLNDKTLNSHELKKLPTVVQKIVSHHRDMFDQLSTLPPDRPENHTIRLEPDTKPPRWRPLRRQDDIESISMQKQIDELLTRGFIQHSNSPWGAVAFMVDKKDSGKRMVIDYRDLNAATIKDSTAMPNIYDLRNKVRGKKIFTKLDARDGFYNILINPESRKYTGFRTPFGNFEFNVLPFGLCNSPATFMSLMNHIFRDLYNVCLVIYMDDLLIFSDNEDDHIRHVTEILKRLHENKIFLKLSKCHFFKDKVIFCGAEISQNGISIDPVKFESALALFGPMSTRRDVQRFLGLTNWFKDFIPDYADLCLPLSKLLKKQQPWYYGIDEHTTVIILIHHILSAKTLTYFQPGEPLFCYTDASDFAIGGYLAQKRDNILHPILFWSRKLIAAELNYSTHEKECLALVAMIKKHHFYFQTGPVICHTDSTALTYLQKQPTLSRRQVNWVEVLQEHDLHIQHISGTLNPVADFLSRHPNFTPKCMNCRKPSHHHATTPIHELDWDDTRQIPQPAAFHDTSIPSLADFPDDTLATNWKVFALITDQNLNNLLWHRRMGHAAYSTLLKTKDLVTGLDIDSSIRNLPPCEHCQLANAKHRKRPTSSSKSPYPGMLLHMDHGEFSVPTIHGETAYLLYVDDADHYAEFAPQRRLTAKETLATFKKLEAREENLNSRKIHKLRRFRSDESGAFAGEFQDYVNSKGIIQEFSNRYDHQQNGFVERLHRTIQEKHRAQMEYNKVPMELQGYSLQYATYLTNRTYTTTEPMTPYEKRTGKKPDLSHLRIFYSPAIVPIPRELQTKHRTIHGLRCRYLGPSPSHDGNIFINVENHHIFTAKDAIIFEDWETNPTLNIDDYLLYFDEPENPYDDDYTPSRQRKVQFHPKIKIRFHDPRISSSGGVLSHETRDTGP
jgi:hypothetical protein